MLPSAPVDGAQRGEAVSVQEAREMVEAVAKWIIDKADEGGETEAEAAAWERIEAAAERGPEVSLDDVTTVAVEACRRVARVAAEAFVAPLCGDAPTAR